MKPNISKLVIWHSAILKATQIYAYFCYFNYLTMFSQKLKQGTIAVRIGGQTHSLHCSL